MLQWKIFVVQSVSVQKCHLVQMWPCVQKSHRAKVTLVQMSRRAKVSSRTKVSPRAKVTPTQTKLIKFIKKKSLKRQIIIKIFTSHTSWEYTVGVRRKHQFACSFCCPSSFLSFSQHSTNMPHNPPEEYLGRIASFSDKEYKGLKINYILFTKLFNFWVLT